jgi:alcohol dehydrogenase (nicotinoprotein)
MRVLELRPTHEPALDTYAPEHKEAMDVKTRAAVLWEVGKNWSVEELDLDGPAEGEVLIRYTHAGLCHSDEHMRSGDIVPRLPIVGGHEGAGIVEDVGPGVNRVKVGDHVVCSFIPACGICRWCATGQQQICDLGATMMEGCLPGGHFAFHRGETDIGGTCMLGTFSEYGTVSQASVVRVDDDLPLDKAVLVGCGVPTGWGSAVYAAKVEPGDTVVIYGIGGVGANAVQGARIAGAKYLIAVDPLENKREMGLRLGATHAAADAGEAAELAQRLTNGVGADKAIITVDVVDEAVVAAGFDTIRKGGVLVITGVGNLQRLTVHLPSVVMTFFRKEVKGALFGNSNPTYDIPKLLGLYRSGDLELDALVTRTYRLDEVNEGYQDLLDGKNIRGVIALSAI